MCTKIINTDNRTTAKFDITNKVVESLFEQCFLERYNTVLVGGADEPLYQPANLKQPQNVIYYRDDYISSAFHEIAHWCIAGKKRRTLLDYGYWYAPDGRNQAQQKAFESVEVKPQALEYAFSLSAGIHFRVSIDNLAADLTDSERIQQERTFTQQVSKQLNEYINTGFGHRANVFIKCLQQVFNTQGVLNKL